MKPEKREYAVYKGENLLCVGTASECAEELNVTSRYIRWMATPIGKKRMEARKRPERAMTAVKLEDEE